MTELEQLRQQIITARQALTSEQCSNATNKISIQLFALNIFQQSKKIACYLNFRNEVGTETIIKKIWELKKLCYLPIITKDKSLLYSAYNEMTPLVENQYSLLEPKLENNIIDTSLLDLVIVPLVAFDKKCTRIGWGQGHYDRCFNFLQTSSRPNKPYLVGIAYELQKKNHLKRESWDIPLDAVITESTIYYPEEK